MNDLSSCWNDAHQMLLVYKVAVSCRRTQDCRGTKDTKNETLQASSWMEWVVGCGIRIGSSGSIMS